MIKTFEENGNSDYCQTLKTIPNPNPKSDYVTQLSIAPINDVSVTIAYVPDKLILIPDTLAIYLENKKNFLCEPLEDFAQKLLEAINNEVIPRWIRITLQYEPTATLKRKVTVIDQQPKWNKLELITSFDC